MLLKKIPPLFYVLILIAEIILLPHAHTLSSLELTLTTHKPTYYIGENVYIYGNLTLDGNLVTDGLVGLEVDTPIDSRLLIRTLTTNTTPTENWLIEVLNVVPCDQDGKPKNTFAAGTFAHFNVTVKNNDIELRQVLITINIYDYSRAPLGVSSYEFPIKENTTELVRISFPISTKSANGLATVYANAYSDRPRMGGKPYCPEKSNTLQITGGITASPNPIQQELIKGNYNMTFKLSMERQLGTYNVYATAIYQGLPALNITTFQINVLGDANGDGVVDGKDAGILGLHWPPQPYDPQCDFNSDGVIDGKDAGIMGANWGYGT